MCVLKELGPSDTAGKESGPVYFTHQKKLLTCRTKSARRFLDLPPRGGCFVAGNHGADSGGQGELREHAGETSTPDAAAPLRRLPAARRRRARRPHHRLRPMFAPSPSPSAAISCSQLTSVLLLPCADTKIDWDAYMSQVVPSSIE